MGKRALIILALLYRGPVLSQTLYLLENFSYGPSDNPDITAISDWVRHGGTQGPVYSSASLTYGGYESSGIDGCLGFTKGGAGVDDGDVGRGTGFTLDSNGTVYFSFLVNISAAQGTNDYFVHLGPASIGNVFRSRVFAKRNGTGFSLGISKASETPLLDNTVLGFGQTYLFVLKYVFSTATTSDDLITLFVYENGVPTTEFGSPLVMIGPYGDGVAGDPGDIGTLALRQGTNTPTGFVDGIRVSDGWALAPLPVELTAFTASLHGPNVELRWHTDTELENTGFEVQRKATTTDWVGISFVEGSGTTSAPHTYCYIDPPPAGIYWYRLKQIDRDGSYHFSETQEVTMSALSGPTILDRNYPNPFNPTTVIGFTVPFTAHVTLLVYNMLGQEVCTLVNGVVEGGRPHLVRFDATSLPSGIYFYSLRSGGGAQTREMILMK